MEIHVLQHVPFEGPGSVASWAEQRGHRLNIVHLYRGEFLPTPAETNMLIVMGGPMGANDTAIYPWMAEEKRLIRQLLEASQVPILGICLGSQLIASCLDQEVAPGPVMEVGWHPIQLTPTASSDRVAWPEGLVPLHWHRDTFTLPPAAKRLASTKDFPNQAFRWDERVVGLQFHFEATPESVALLCAEASEDLGHSVWQQPYADITDCHERCAATRPMLYALLDDLAEQV